MKRIVTLMIFCISNIFCILPVNAQTKVMSDDFIFDADFYAEQNLDVVAVVGTDEYALYQHYNNAGEKEGRLAVAIQGAAVVSREPITAYDSLLGYVYTLEDGTLARVTNRQYCNPVNSFDNKYIIPRTDYSTGLLDEDGNGIDDRDPYNDMGYSDFNYNGIADEAPAKADYPYSKETGYSLYVRTCKHNIVGGERAKTVNGDNLWCICSICEDNWKTYLEDLRRRIEAGEIIVE